MAEERQSGVCSHCGRDSSELEALVARFGEMVAYLEDHIERRAREIAAARLAEPLTDDD